MSIFPKRTKQGATVTIHWNFNTAHIIDLPLFPFVRIGVTDPLGHTTMLMEQYVLALPVVQPGQAGQLLHLNKNLPLMVMSDYLSGKQSREKMVDILQNIQTGRHYYFHYQVPLDAPLGKYTLISEVISEGQIRLSKTAADDHFFVENMIIEYAVNQPVIYNPSPESLPVKIIDYIPDNVIDAEQIKVFELAPGEKRQITVKSDYAYVSYNEERELLPLKNAGKAVVRRNAEWLQLEKPDKLYLFHRTEELAYQLTETQQNIWLAADGVKLAEEVKSLAPEAYNELLEKQIIAEYIKE